MSNLTIKFSNYSVFYMCSWRQLGKYKKIKIQTVPSWSLQLTMFRTRPLGSVMPARESMKSDIALNL